MARTGSIRHPRRSYVAVLREDYVRICDGNLCAAMILSQMEYWHDVKLEAVAQAEAHNEAARRAGEEPDQDTELWVYKSLPEMKDELMGLFGDKAIAAGYAYLAGRQYLESRTNPRFTWDRTRQYLFNVPAVQAAVDQLGPSDETDGGAPDAPPPPDAGGVPAQGAELPSCKPQICGLEGAEMPLASRKNAAAIPETTPKKTNKEIQTLNVGRPLDFVGNSAEVGAPPRSPQPHSRQAQWLDKRAGELAAQLHDLGSQRRHRQLLSVCEQHGLWDLPAQALDATRRRLDAEGSHGPLEKPGAYYQRVLVALLNEHQVFVPTLAEQAEDDP
ncbi:MAG: hypothetical protein JO250_09770, partial [Armatimonadetes bacterium]|nr:hypothetical protein [Armatimonadota bacterium]